MKKIIIVVPCYNEEETLPHLIDALEHVRTELSSQYKVDFILVNDGSTDRTHELAENLAKERDHVYFRSLANNSGHQSALRAGINASVGYDAAIMMDADLQHPPELIASMLEAWEAGAKIVQMVRKDSHKEVGTFKYLTSRGYYKLINVMSDLKLDYGASDFRLIDDLVIRLVASSRENDLFLRGYFSWLPIPKTVLPYKPQHRIAGQSKYDIRKLLKLAYEGILQFSEKPLLIAMVMGTMLAAISFAYGAVIVARFVLFGTHLPSGWSSLMVTVLFFFGVNFMLIGVVGAYLAHAIRLEKQRPEFLIDGEKTPKT